LGDEVISVYGVSLEGLSFDDIISTVRKVSTTAEGGWTFDKAIQSTGKESNVKRKS